jgi:hypothetical protein
LKEVDHAETISNYFLADFDKLPLNNLPKNSDENFDSVVRMPEHETLKAATGQPASLTSKTALFA